MMVIWAIIFWQFQAKKQKAEQKELDEYEDIEATNLARLTVNEDTKSMVANLVTMKETWTVFSSNDLGMTSLSLWQFIFVIL